MLDQGRIVFTANNVLGCPYCTGLQNRCSYTYVLHDDTACSTPAKVNFEDFRSILPLTTDDSQASAQRYNMS